VHGVELVQVPPWLWCFLDLLFCLCLSGGRLSPLWQVVRLPGLLRPCLPLGLLGLSPAQVALACRSQGELIPPRSYLCLRLGPGPQSCVGLVPSSGVGVLGVAGTNHVAQWPKRGGTGLVPSGCTYLSSGLLHSVGGVKARQGPSLLRPGVALVGLRLFHPTHGTRLGHLGPLGVRRPKGDCTVGPSIIRSWAVQRPIFIIIGPGSLYVCRPKYLSRSGDSNRESLRGLKNLRRE